MMLINILLRIKWLLTNYTIFRIGKLFLRLEFDTSHFHVGHQLYLDWLVDDGRLVQHTHCDLVYFEIILLPASK